MENHKLSIVIVTWNNEKDIDTCLKSLESQDYVGFNVIVVDNKSSDKTVEKVKSFPNVRLIELPKNIFLTGGNNLGIRYAVNNYNPEYVMVLNPDTKSEPNLVSSLLSAANMDERIAAVGPKIKFFNNENEGLINSTGLIYDGFMQAYDRGIFEEDKGQYDRTEEVSAVSGACILYRADALKQVGVYWDAIKMYLDELELSIRLKKAGWKIMYTSQATLWHSYMVSSKQNSNLNVGKQKMKAWLLIALRHYPLLSKLAMFKKYLLS